MPPWIITIGLPLLKQILTDAPEIKKSLAELLSKEDVTEADWNALEQRIRSGGYEQLVPHSGLKTPPA